MEMVAIDPEGNMALISHYTRELQLKGAMYTEQCMLLMGVNRVGT